MDDFPAALFFLPDLGFLELAVVVLPLLLRRDRLNGVPVFGDLAMFNPKQVLIWFWLGT